MVYIPFGHSGLRVVLRMPFEPKRGEEAHCGGRNIFGNGTGHHRLRAVLYVCGGQADERFPGRPQQHQPLYEHGPAGDGVGEPVPGLCAFVRAVCHLVGHQRLVPVDGRRLVRGGAVALV